MRSIPAIARSSVSAYGASRAGVSTILGAGAGPERPSLQGFSPYFGVLHRTLCLYKRRNVEALRLKGDRRYAEEVAAQPAPASPSMSDSPLSCTPSKHARSPRNGEGHRGGPLELCGPPLARAPRSLSDRRRGERPTKTLSLPPADAPPLGVDAERSPRPSCLASLPHRTEATRRATRDPGPRSGERCSS